MLKNQVEALLFAAGKYISEEDISNIAGESTAKVKKSLEELKAQYSNSDGALTIIEANGRWKMNVKEEHLTLVRKIVADAELEKPVLETLAVVAWKRPILQSEVINTRGAHAYEHIRLLLDEGFITREKQGRTYKLRLSEKFFEYFDVEGDKEIRELFSVVQKPEPKKVGKLEVVDLEKEKQQQLEKDLEENKLGQLEIVNADPYEKWKEDHEELEKIDEELNKISERANVHIKEIDKYRPAEEDKDAEEQDVVEENL